MNKHILLIGLLSLLMISTPIVFSEEVRIEVLAESISAMTVMKKVLFGAIPVNSAKMMPILELHDPAVNSSFNITLNYYSGYGNFNYKLIAPAGTPDGWANGKTIDIDTKYNIPLDKIGNYSLELVPISNADRNITCILEIPDGINATQMT